MYSNKVGQQNTAIGAGALYNLNSSYNTAIGFDAGNNTYGSTNTMIGHNANSNNYNYSTAIGYNASNTGSNQVILGTTSETVFMPGNSTIGSSSSNTSTFNAIPNFVNGFSCNGGTSRQIYMGVANCNSGNLTIGGGGDTTFTFTLDTTINSSITGGFVNTPSQNFCCTYYNQLNTTEITVAVTNLSSVNNTLSSQIQYMFFV
jgi:hypothetical protein